VIVENRPGIYESQSGFVFRLLNIIAYLHNISSLGRRPVIVGGNPPKAKLIKHPWLSTDI